MVSAGYATARPNAHHYQTSGLAQSNTQYLKEAYGLSASPTNTLGTQNVLPNENEWPSLSNAAMFGLDHHDRADSQQRSLGRKLANSITTAQTLGRRPASIGGRVGMPQQGLPIGAVQQMSATQQMQQKQAQQTAINNSVNNSAAKNPKLYKTELCRSWADSGRCNYGERCQYAHGETEKRPIPRHPKYKTEACQSYHQNGYCAYGTRCHFIHAPSEASFKPQIPQMQSQSPIRPNNLFPGAAAPGVCSSPTFDLQQRGTPVTMSSIAPNNSNTIAQVASLAASAYNQNPNFFSHQFQTQLQIFNDGLKNPPHAGNLTSTQPSGLGETGGSTGDSPVPSSNDSGTESPICSFSPGSELDDPTFFFVRKQLEATKSTGLKLPSGVPLNLLPSSLNSDAESGFSSSSSTSSNVGTKSLNSPVIGSPPHLATAPTGIWSNGGASTSTSAVARLPVFERLSNGP